VSDYKAELAKLLDRVDLDLEPHEQASAEVSELARERARNQPEGLKYKFIDQTAPVEAALTGEVEAKVSDTLPDREGERFTRDGFDRAVRRFREAGRPLPLLFGHDTKHVHNVIGMVTDLEVK
jgi:hypothetical protein